MVAAVVGGWRRRFVRAGSDIVVDGEIRRRLGAWTVEVGQAIFLDLRLGGVVMRLDTGAGDRYWGGEVVVVGGVWMR